MHDPEFGEGVVIMTGFHESKFGKKALENCGLILKDFYAGQMFETPEPSFDVLLRSARGSSPYFDRAA